LFLCIQSEDFNFEELEKFEILWKMFTIEMVSKDDLQKRHATNDAQALAYFMHSSIQRANRVDYFYKAIDIVREYNHLVESNFKTKHQVADYAKC
jgi:hypothetical protein